MIGRFCPRLIPLIYFHASYDLQILQVNAAIKAAAEDGAGIQWPVPFNLMRSFHPKATVYGVHAEALFAAIADNNIYADLYAYIDDYSSVAADDSPELARPPSKVPFLP